MISKQTVKRFCKDDISLIENYDLAVNSDETWHCHHRREIENDGTLHSRKWLIDNDLYYNRPACELIFLTHSEHTSLHSTGEKNPMYGKHLYGEKNPFYGKKHSYKTRKKMSESKIGEKNPSYGSKWMTNSFTTLKVKQNDINTYLSNGYRFGRK